MHLVRMYLSTASISRCGGEKQLWNEKRSRKLEISPERLCWLNPISLWINRPFTQVMIKGDLNVIRKSLSSIEQ